MKIHISTTRHNPANTKRLQDINKISFPPVNCKKSSYSVMLEKLMRDRMRQTKFFIRKRPSITASPCSKIVTPFSKSPNDFADLLNSSLSPYGNDKSAVSYTHLTLPTNREV
eukprot:TRINITY_DN12294_c0_g3_i1.p1 TRINITY_DN12294_c0_g3~~TRINITY_DN12294_c0_g3_i1.p1  ORF type:complete len:121 (+),score=12.67 TRINITY_DN12294_c0_g3_i1:29-364(+)